MIASSSLLPSRAAFLSRLSRRSVMDDRSVRAFMRSSTVHFQAGLGDKEFSAASAERASTQTDRRMYFMMVSILYLVVGVKALSLLGRMEDSQDCDPT